MKTKRLSSEKGFALIYLAVTLTFLLLMTGLALDGGRAYVVKAQLTKAVDGAALGAARMLNSGNPVQEATSIFRANFPTGWMGTTSVTDPPSVNVTTDAAAGVNIVHVSATAVLPTTFISLANINTVTVAAEGEARRRMVDLSLVLDVSGSIGWRWPYVRDASIAFINAFSRDFDRLSLILYSTGSTVEYPMPASRGFDKPYMISQVPNALPGGSTSMVMGLYRGWDELRTVPTGQQSGLRVIVLFTDGASNSVPALWDGSGVSKGYRSSDFPKNNPDPDNMTHNNPGVSGLFHTETAVQGPSFSFTPFWSDTTTHASARWMPATSFHSQRRSTGIPNTFPLQDATLTVNGVAQTAQAPAGRGLRNLTAGRYPADVWNLNNASRNLVEIIADRARADADGDYPIRIFSIGMGELVRYQLGTRRETSESMLMRVANDRRSPDFNPAQMEGKYYFAQTEADVDAAFQALQAQIIRLSK
jgi:Flp pilus assembly protein TadG